MAETDFLTKIFIHFLVKHGAMASHVGPHIAERGLALLPVNLEAHGYAITVTASARLSRLRSGLRSR